MPPKGKPAPGKKPQLSDKPQLPVKPSPVSGQPAAKPQPLIAPRGNHVGAIRAQFGGGGGGDGASSADSKTSGSQNTPSWVKSGIGQPGNKVESSSNRSHGSDSPSSAAKTNKSGMLDESQNRKHPVSSSPFKSLPRTGVTNTEDKKIKARPTPPPKCADKPPFVITADSTVNFQKDFAQKVENNLGIKGQELERCRNPGGLTDSGNQKKVRPTPPPKATCTPPLDGAVDSQEKVPQKSNFSIIGKELESRLKSGPTSHHDKKPAVPTVPKPRPKPAPALKTDTLNARALGHLQAKNKEQTSENLPDNRNPSRPLLPQRTVPDIQPKSKQDSQPQEQHAKNTHSTDVSNKNCISPFASSLTNALCLESQGASHGDELQVLSNQNPTRKKSVFGHRKVPPVPMLPPEFQPLPQLDPDSAKVKAALVSDPHDTSPPNPPAESNVSKTEERDSGNGTLDLEHASSTELISDMYDDGVSSSNRGTCNISFSSITLYFVN